MNCRQWFIVGYNYESGKILNFGDSYTVPKDDPYAQAFRDGRDLAIKHLEEFDVQIGLRDIE